MPLTPTRAALITGPARIVRKNVAATDCSLFTKDDIGVDIVQAFADKSSSFHGPIDKVFLGQHVEASFTPAGHVNNDLCALLWNDFANLAMSYDLTNSAADVPCLFHSADGGGTIIASAITKLPDIILGPNRSMMGSMTIAGVVGTGLALSAASSLYTIGGNTTVVDTALTSASFRQQCYTAVWGAVTGFTSFEAEEEWTISFNMRTKMHAVAGNIRKITFQGIDILARCVPVGPTEAQIGTALGLSQAGTVPGRAQATVASQLVITGTDTTTTVTIPKASLVSGGFKFGDEVLRQGELGWYASRDFSVGAQSALYTIAAG